METFVLISRMKLICVNFDYLNDLLNIIIHYVPYNVLIAFDCKSTASDGISELFLLFALHEYTYIEDFYCLFLFDVHRGTRKDIYIRSLQKFTKMSLGEQMSLNNNIFVKFSRLWNKER